MKRAAILLVGLAAASGCISVLPKARPPAPRYVLSPAAINASAELVDWTLSIEDPTAIRAYDSMKIVAIREKGRLEFLANGEWADKAPRLIQTILIQTFENSGRILGVGDRTQIIGGDFVLLTDLRTIHVDYSAAPAVARIDIQARLLDRRGAVIGAKRFESETAVDENSPAAIARALDASVAGAIGPLAEWTLALGQAARADQAK
jgi:cholesterol transport system auxiliary component